MPLLKKNFFKDRLEAKYPIFLTFGETTPSDGHLISYRSTSMEPCAHSSDVLTDVACWLPSQCPSSVPYYPPAASWNQFPNKLPLHACLRSASGDQLKTLAKGEMV